MGALEGKIAIVTGAGRGIGAAIAEAYSREGATVVVSDIDATAAESRVAQLPGNASAFACDVADEEQVAALVAHATDTHGGLDVLVANAGIAPPVAPVTEFALADWRRLMSINLDGVFLSIKHGAPAIAAGGGGTIIAMASVTALAGLPLGASYAASKAAVVSLAKSAALELRPHNVRVNALCPGFVGTELVANIAEPFSAALGADLGELIERGQGRMGLAEDVTPVAVWLASDAAQLATGAPFVVDGALTASML